MSAIQYIMFYLKCMRFVDTVYTPCAFYEASQNMNLIYSRKRHYAIISDWLSF